MRLHLGAGTRHHGLGPLQARLRHGQGAHRSDDRLRLGGPRDGGGQRTHLDGPPAEVFIELLQLPEPVAAFDAQPCAAYLVGHLAVRLDGLPAHLGGVPLAGVELVDDLGPKAVVELTQLIALENMYSRFNSAVGLHSQGYSDVCELPLAVPSRS